MSEYEIERLGTGKQYIVWGAILSLLSIAAVMIFHLFTYGWAIPFTENELNTMQGLPCLVVLELGALFTLENTYL